MATRMDFQREGNTMRLKPRLAALAEAVPPGGVVADIGTDHALLPVHLVKKGLAGKVIAVENRPTTLEQARRTLNRFQYLKPVELRLGSGLEPIRREDGVETVIIAGMGGRTICGILLAGREKWGWFKQLVLQPMQESALLRRWLLAHGMCLAAERLVQEGKRFYEIMVVRRGKQVVRDPLTYELGPCLIAQKDPLLEPFIRQKIERCRAIAGALQRSGQPENRKKERYYRERETRLREVLEACGPRWR